MVVERDSETERERGRKREGNSVRATIKRERRRVDSVIIQISLPVWIILQLCSPALSTTVEGGCRVNHVFIDVLALVVLVHG